MHQGRFTSNQPAVGTPLPFTAKRVAEIEEQLRDHEEVVHIHTVVGTERRADSRPDEGEHTARMMFKLKSGGRIERRENQVMESVRQVIDSLDGVQPEVRMVRPSLFSFRTPVEVILYDNDLERLQLSANRVVQQLNQIDSLTDIQSSLAEGYPEVQIDYDRTLLSRFGLTTNQVARQVRDKILGTTATTISGGDGRVDLTVRLNPEQRRGVDNIKRRTSIHNRSTHPAASVATFSDRRTQEIRRVDQRERVISANRLVFDYRERRSAFR